MASIVLSGRRSFLFPADGVRGEGDGDEQRRGGPEQRREHRAAAEAVREEASWDLQDQVPRRKAPHQQRLPRKMNFHHAKSTSAARNAF